MTLNEFLDSIPWEKFQVNVHGGGIRCIGQCPLAYVLKTDNITAMAKSSSLGLHKDDIMNIIASADIQDEEYLTPSNIKLRAEMIRRIGVARGILARNQV